LEVWSVVVAPGLGLRVDGLEVWSVVMAVARSLPARPAPS